MKKREKEHKPVSLTIPILISVATILGVAFLAAWAKMEFGEREAARMNG